MTESIPAEERITSVETRMVMAEAEIASLRASRHDHGALLQVHETEIKLLAQSVKDGHAARLAKLEETSDDHAASLASLAADVRVLVWRVGAVTGFVSGALWFVLTALTKHFPG